MRGKTVLALAMDEQALTALRVLRQRIADWALPVQWFDDELLGVPLVTIARSEVRWGADFDLLLSTLDPLACTFTGLGATGRGASMILHAAVDDLGEWCVGWHQDLAAALGVAIDPDYRPRVPLGRVPLDPDAASVWQGVFTAIGQAPFGGGGSNELVAWHRDAIGRWRCGQRWSLTASAWE